MNAREPRSEATEEMRAVARAEAESIATRWAPAHMTARQGLVDDIASSLVNARRLERDKLALAVAAEAARQKRISAAHILDRAAQYASGSGIITALEEVATQIACGEAEDADAHGEFEPELLRRVERKAMRRRR